MEVIALIAIFSSLIGSTRSILKCCPLYYELSISKGNPPLVCVPSTSGTLSVTYTDRQIFNMPVCNNYDLVSAYSRYRNAICMDWVSQFNDVFGVACNDPASIPSFPIPSIVSFRKCCPRGRKYDADRQNCWGPYSDDYPNALQDTLKIVFRRNDTFVNVTFGAPACRRSEVLVDDVVPYKRVSFLEERDALTIDGKDGILSTPDDFCADIVDHQFEYVVIRSCRNTHSECGPGKNVCVRKCCPVDFELQSKSCAPSKRPLSMRFYNLSDTYAPIPSAARTQLAFLQGFECPAGKYVLEDEGQDRHILTTDGTIFMVATNTVLDTSEYCLENFKGSNETKTLRCFRENPKPVKIMRMKRFLTTVCATASAFFLLLTFLIYSTLAQLRNEHGKLVMCYLATSAASYLCIVAQQILHYEKLPKEICWLMGYIMLFTVLSSFSWLNVISYDIWSTFKTCKSQFLNKSTTCRRFSFSCLYGWGYPIIWSSLTALCHYTSIMNETSKWKPDIGKASCWFFDYGNSKIIFFLAPVATMIVINVFIFIFTVKYCASIRRELKMSNSNYSARKYNSDKNDFKINLKLFVIMGINWSMEIISMTVQPHNRLFFILSDLMNSLAGVFVFCIFVLKRKVLLSLKGKLCGRSKCDRSIERTTAYTTSSTSSIMLSYVNSRKSVDCVP